jgi:hypothetical protein
MNAELIATTLLDSNEEDFMKSFKLDRPARYAFKKAYGGYNTYGVNRFDWDGSDIYLGTIKFLLNLETWWVVEVAPRIFHRLKSKEGSHLMPRRASYVANQGPFDTKEAAADKLWELYEQG